MEPDKIENETDFENTEALAPTSQNEVASVRTYKSDVAEFIKREGKTMADIAIAESARNTKTLKEGGEAPTLRKKALYIIGAIFTLIIVSLGVFYFALKPRQDSPVMTETGEIAPAMFVSGIKEKKVSIGMQSVSGTLSSLDIALKDIHPFLGLIIMSEDRLGQETLLDSRAFFERIGIYPPAVLIRTLDDQFSVGSIGGKARFLVLKNNYYSGAFSGMLQWEEKMAEDLRTLLSLPVEGGTGAIKTVAGTTTMISGFLDSGFKDAVIGNRDTRIYKDASGKTILLYLFPDNNTIIIAGSESTVKIVYEKLLKLSD
ncbi:MAG TPA: hypothetical protein VJI33_03720 [Candidatus Paceibacterota bacterium]